MLSPAELKQMLTDAGACAVGFAPLREVDPKVMEEYINWISEGYNGEMGYLANNIELRRNPALLLAGGSDPRPGGTVISLAFAYYSGNDFNPNALKFARYSLGDDYHDVLRDRLRPIASSITEHTGCEARICVDTAPVLERYWAQQAGIGFIGRNHQLIVPGIGSHIFLAEIITRAILPYDTPCRLNCPPGCHRCQSACPVLASRLDDSVEIEAAHTPIDPRLCHSYLSIEYRGELPDRFRFRKRRIYGCDLCLEACPLAYPEDNVTVTILPEFQPRESLLDLTAERLANLSPEEYSLIFRHSAIKRAKLKGLLRNLRHLP